MPDLPEVGLRAVIENLDQFQRGARTIAEAYEYVVKAEEKVAKKSPEAAAALEQLRKAFVDSGGDIRDWANAVEDSMDQTGDAMETLAKITGAGAIQQVAGTLGSIGDRILGLAKDSVETAARIEELGFVMGNLAEQNNISEQALRGQVQAIRDQGIQADVAYNLVSQFVRANLDLGSASNLARLAQDAAVISMEDSSQALQGLLHGILTLQPELLRYRGIIVDFQSEYKKWADANDRTVLSLTSAEKQAIALEAALAQGASIAGTYTSAMESASKQLRSMPRYIADLKAEMGDALLPVYSEVVFTTKDLIKEISGLPGPIKAAIAASGTLSGGLLKGTSAMVSMGSQVAQLVLGLQALGVELSLTKLALTGLGVAGVGIAAAIGVGLYSAVKAAEEAHRAEAAAILDSAETYDEYVREAERAELGSYTLSESLYEIAKGADAAREGVDALALTEAWRELELFFGIGGTGIEWLDSFAKDTLPAVGVNIDDLVEQITYFSETWDDAKLAVLANEEVLRRIGIGLDLTGDKLDEFVVRTQEVIQAQQDYRIAAESAEESDRKLAQTVENYIQQQEEARDVAGKFGGEILESAAYVAGYDQQIQDLADDLSELTLAALEADPAVAGLTEQLLRLIEKEGEQAAIAYSIQQLADISRQAEEDITQARNDAQQEREKALQQHQAKVEALEEDHGDRRADIMDDLADVQADLLADMAAAEAEYQQERLQLEQEGIQALAELEQEYANAQAQARQDLLDDLADADRKANEKRADAARDLARDLEDIERESAARIEDIAADYQQRLLDLAEQRREAEAAAAERHAQNLLALEERYARQRESIEERYRTEATEEELRDEERRALLEHLADLRRLEQEGRTGIDYTQQINDTLAQLDELKQAELAALEEARQEELDALAAALAEEEAVRQAAYDEAVAAEETRYQEALAREQAAAEERKGERQRQYDRQLADLNTQLEREKAERERAYQEQLADLAAAHAQELAETQRANAEALAALDEQNEQEKLRLQATAADRRAALAERLADEQASYAERLTALNTAYDDQQTTIDTKLGEQLTTIQTKADEQTQTMITAWENINPGIASALDTTINNVIRPRIDGMIAEIHRLMNEMARLGQVGQSPAPWWLKVGESWGEGLEQGSDLTSVFDDQLAEMDKFKTDAERMFEVASPSKWAGRLGESVAAGFDGSAVFTPQMGDVPDMPNMGVSPFLSDMPTVDGQDMGVSPFLTDVPQVPDQTMAVTPFLTDMPLLEPQQVQAATPPAMAAGGAMQSVSNEQSYNLNYTGQQHSEPSMRALMTMLEMRASHG